MKKKPRPLDSVVDGDPGRGPDGRFLPGNKLAKGNPYARKVAALRSALFSAVKPADLVSVVGKMLALAVGGDVQAAKLILDRVLGPPLPLDIVERLETLESKLGGENHDLP